MTHTRRRPAPTQPTTRRAPAALLLLAALVACSSVTVDTTGDLTERRIVDVTGEQRSYLAYAPEGVNPRGAPVILVFHGAGGNAEGMLLGTDVFRVAQELRAVLAVPEADHVNWAEDCGCTNADQVHGVADTAFVSTLLADLGAAWGTRTDGARVVGFSQGGMFAQRLACQMADRVEAVVVLAATMSVQLAGRCAPARPIDLLVALPMNDPVFPWEGTPTGNFATLGALAVGTLWAELNGCAAEPARTQESGATRWRWSGCAGAVRLELLGVDPGAHSWIMSTRIDTAAEIARFLGS